MTAHRHRWTAPDRPDVLECADCGAICTWDLTDRSTHPDARRDREAAPERKPVAGWRHVSGTTWALHAQPDDRVLAFAWHGAARWESAVLGFQAKTNDATDVDSALLAAEDALIAVRDEISRAVGR